MYGTLDMLILKALQHEPRHGLAVADRIQQISQEVLRVEQGSLYPALYRLEAEGLIKAEWGISDKPQSTVLRIDLGGPKKAHGRKAVLGSHHGGGEYRAHESLIVSTARHEPVSRISGSRPGTISTPKNRNRTV